MPATVDSPHTNGRAEYRSSRRRSPEEEIEDPRKDRKDRRHRSRSPDKDRKEKDRGERKDKDKDRERRSEKDREREKSDRHRERERGDKDKDRHADRHAERDRLEPEKPKDRDRDRDRERSERHAERERDREREQRHRKRSEPDDPTPLSDSRAKRPREETNGGTPKGLSIMGAASGGRERERTRERGLDVDMDEELKSRSGKSDSSRRGMDRDRDRDREPLRERRERPIDRDRDNDMDRDRRSRDPPPHVRDGPPQSRYRDDLPPLPPSPRGERRRSPPPHGRRGGHRRPIEADTYIPGQEDIGSPPRPLGIERVGSRDRDNGYGPPRDRRSPPMRGRPSPSYDAPPLPNGPPPVAEDPVNTEDSEARSVFVSQLAARLTARDLGYFFEEKLGEGSVLDARIVTDRVSRRSKGIAYVELKSIDLVGRAIALTGTVVMGLPIMVQLTESERNRIQASGSSMHLPPGVTAPPPGSMQLYVGSLHFNLTENDIKQVFEPFGELEFVDLHRDPLTGRSKGFAFVQYKRSEDAKMALEQMDGFDLAGRQLKVNTVHEKGAAVRYGNSQAVDSLDENGGGNLNAASRQALMQKLARIEPPKPAAVSRPNVPSTMQSKCVLLRNMFDPEKETEKDWDKELADDVKGECEEKYGPVDFLKVERDSQGEIYIKFQTVEAAGKSVEGLNGRWFGGNQIQAAYIADAILQAHQ